MSHYIPEQNKMLSIELSDVVKIGENDYGYEFAVGRIEKCWVGFAIGNLGGGEKAMFFFPGIQENYQVGVKDKTLAILLTGAIAKDLEQGYGGISTWFVGEELRGDPDAFRYINCDIVGCDGNECQ